MKKLILIHFIFFISRATNIISQDCLIDIRTPDTIFTMDLSVFIDISVSNTQNCFDKLKLINKYAFETFSEQKLLHYIDSPLRVAVFDSTDKFIEPLDSRLYFEYLNGYIDKYKLDTIIQNETFKVGIPICFYRLDYYRTYKLKVFITYDIENQTNILSDHTFYVIKLPKHKSISTK